MARIAARFADEYNTLLASNEELRERLANVRQASEETGRREPLVFSLMTGCVVGADESELHERVGRLLSRFGRDGSPDAFVRERSDRMVVGTLDEAVERLRDLERLGVQRIFLQHLVHEDVDMVRLLGERVAPAVAA